MEEQNLPTEEQESPQPEVPQNSGPEAAKKSGMRWLIAGFVLVLILLGLYFFAVPMFQDAGVDDTDSPPRASMDQGGKFQGAIFDGPMGFLVYEKSDETKFNSYKAGLSTDQKSKPTLIGKNVGYYYSEKSIEFNDIVECIDPKAGQVLVMFYSPGEAGDRQENYQKGFYTYPKGPFVDNDSVKFYRAQGYMRIPAGRGFVVISKSTSEAYCFEDATKLGSITPSNPVELGTAGWTMIAAKNTDVDTAISSLEPNVRSVWVQEARGPVQLKRNADGKYATTLTGSKLLWVKMDGMVKKKVQKVDLSGIKPPELNMTVDGNKITLSWTPLSAEDSKNFAGYMLYYVPLNKKVIAEDSTLEKLKSELSGTEEFYFLKNNAKGSEWYPQLYKAVDDATAKLKAAGVSDVELKAGINTEYLKIVKEVSLSLDKSSFVINDHTTDLNSALQYVFMLSPVPLDIEQSDTGGTFKIFTPDKTFGAKESLKTGSLTLTVDSNKLSFSWEQPPIEGKGGFLGYSLIYVPLAEELPASTTNEALEKYMIDKNLDGFLINNDKSVKDIMKENQKGMVEDLDKLKSAGASASEIKDKTNWWIKEMAEELRLTDEISELNYEIGDYAKALKPAKQYLFRLNTIGLDYNYMASYALLTPEVKATKPSIPTALIWDKTDPLSPVLSWSAAQDNGSAIKGYKIKAAIEPDWSFSELKGGQIITGTTYTLNADELTLYANKTVKLMIAAENEVGELSEFSEVVTLELSVVESEPLAAAPVTPKDLVVKAIPKDKAILLTWTHDKDTKNIMAEGYRVFFNLIDGEKIEEYPQGEVKAENLNMEYIVKSDSESFMKCLNSDAKTGFEKPPICTDWYSSNKG